MADNLDLTAQIFYAREHYEWRNSALKDNGNYYEVSIGVKYRPAPALQIHPEVGYGYFPKTSRLGTYRSPFVATGVSYDFHRNFGVAATVGLSKGGAWSWHVGPRFTW